MRSSLFFYFVEKTTCVCGWAHRVLFVGFLLLSIQFYVLYCHLCSLLYLILYIIGEMKHRYVIPLFHTGPESHELTRIDKYLDSWLNRTQFVKILTDRTVRSEFLQFVGLSGIRLKSFELFKTLATNSPIRKIVRDIVTES